MKYRVVIPDEVFAVREWQDEGLPAICVVNQGLANFEPKVVFAWHLSIILKCQELRENGMPSPEEKRIIDQFGDKLAGQLKADGNALFLARITWNATRQLLYRVYDPEVANEFLTDLISSESYIRDFDFRMEQDEAWELAAWYLTHWQDTGAAADDGGSANT